jgi:hypothetical protein
MGWFLLFYIFNKHAPEDCCIPFKSKENDNKIFFDPVTASSLGPDILDHSLYKGPNIFFTMWTLWVSKDPEFYVDFKNKNIPSWNNAHTKSYCDFFPFFTKKFPPLYTVVYCTVCHNKMWPTLKRLLCQTNLFQIFHTFLKVYNNIQG